MADEPSIDEPMRFVDILTTAAAISVATNASEVGAEQVSLAVRVVAGDLRMDDIGETIHPLLVRGSDDRPVPPEVQALVQRWYAELGGTAAATLTHDESRQLLRDLTALVDSDAQPE